MGSNPLAKYSVKLKLGSGGMADVWLATVRGPKGFEKEVVLKTMLPNNAQNSELVEMFAQEAALAAKLNHPGIVQIYDFGGFQGLFYIAMEYVVGCTLRHLMTKAQRQFNLQNVLPLLHLIADCCESIEYVHSLGLVHRDISPENVMVTLTGHSKLLDFGVATSSFAEKRTRHGLVKGKYAYMSPEAVRGERDSAQRDIYSLGVIVYETLTGQRPFIGKSDAELIYRITSDRPRPLRELNPDVPEDLEEIAMMAIASRPEQRYSSATALASELRASLRWHGSDLDRVAFSHRVAEAFSEKGLPMPRRPSAITDASGDFEIVISTSDVESIDSANTDEIVIESLPHGPFDVFSAYSVRRRFDEGRAEKSVFDRAPRPVIANSVAFSSDEATRHFERGLELLHHGDEGGALYEWELASEIDPDNRAYQANVQRLRKRRE
jgi:eukaryotic-like serine/threonine-protein kinase